MAQVDVLTTQSTAAYGMATLISARATQYYDKARVFGGLIGQENKYLVPAGVKSIEVDQLDYLTLAAESEATYANAESFVTTPRTLTPVVATTNILTSWIKNENTNSHMEQIAQAAGIAVANFEDEHATLGFSYLWTEAPTSNPDHLIGADSTALTGSSVRTGWQLLMTAGARPPYNFVVDPIGAEELMRDAEVRTALKKELGDGSYALTTGVDMNRYLGTLYGVHICVANSMIEGSGLHHVMFGQNAIGQGYKLISTPVAPTPSEISIGTDWDQNLRAYRTVVMVCQHNEGIAFTDSTNKFIVCIVS